MSVPVEVKNEQENEVIIDRETLKAQKREAKEQKKGKVQKKDRKSKKSLIRKVSEIFSELKKVSWPSFGKTVKQTGVVLGFVLLCAAILFVICFVLQLGHTAIVNNIVEDTTTLIGM